MNSKCTWTFLVHFFKLPNQILTMNLWKRTWIFLVHPYYKAKEDGPGSSRYIPSGFLIENAPRSSCCIPASFLIKSALKLHGTCSWSFLSHLTKFY